MIKGNKRTTGLIVFMIINCFGMMNLNGQDLQKHEWENRILILKTKDKDSIKYQKQLEAIGNSINDLAERKLILYQIIDDEYEQIDFKENQSTKKGKVSPELYKKTLNEDEAFEIILIGLDGGVKLQKTDILLIEDLNRIIDSMPMRQQEMKMKKLKH